jgi:hypothetical protein
MTPLTRVARRPLGNATTHLGSQLRVGFQRGDRNVVVWTSTSAGSASGEATTRAPPVTAPCPVTRRVGVGPVEQVAGDDQVRAHPIDGDGDPVGSPRSGSAPAGGDGGAVMERGRIARRRRGGPAAIAEMTGPGRGPDQAEDRSNPPHHSAAEHAVRSADRAEDPAARPCCRGPGAARSRRMILHLVERHRRGGRIAPAHPRRGEVAAGAPARTRSHGPLDGVSGSRTLPASGGRRGPARLAREARDSAGGLGVLSRKCRASRESRRGAPQEG